MSYAEAAVRMADTDNLEYYIKFPQPNFNYNQQITENDYVFVVDENKIPVVLLFGWAGCQDKYLAKYSAIYEEKGLITIRYTPPVKYLFWKRNVMKSIGQKLVNLLLEMNFESHPVIIHIFSNGGAFVYQNFSAALESNPKDLQVKGVIFDSAPGKRRYSSLFRAISAIIGGNRFFNISATFLISMFVSVLWIYEVIQSYFRPKVGLKSNDPLERLKVEPFTFPQHFIYSKVDTLIPYHDVESFAECRRKNGVDVTKLRFESSPHVKHYSFHRNEYVNSVFNFIHKCLNGTAKPLRPL